MIFPCIKFVLPLILEFFSSNITEYDIQTFLAYLEVFLRQTKHAILIDWVFL